MLVLWNLTEIIVYSSSLWYIIQLLRFFFHNKTSLSRIMEYASISRNLAESLETTVKQIGQWSGKQLSIFTDVIFLMNTSSKKKISINRVSVFLLLAFSLQNVLHTYTKMTQIWYRLSWSRKFSWSELSGICENYLWYINILTLRDKKKRKK